MAIDTIPPIPRAAQPVGAMPRQNVPTATANGPSAADALKGGGAPMAQSAPTPTFDQPTSGLFTDSGTSALAEEMGAGLVVEATPAQSQPERLPGGGFAGSNVSEPVPAVPGPAPTTKPGVMGETLARPRSTLDVAGFFAQSVPGPQVREPIPNKRG
jgi:hypothetical protein